MYDVHAASLKLHNHLWQSYTNNQKRLSMPLEHLSGPALTLYPATDWQCQRSLAVNPLNSQPAMYIALQLLGVRDDS